MISMFVFCLLVLSVSSAWTDEEDEVDSDVGNLRLLLMSTASRRGSTEKSSKKWNLLIQCPRSELPDPVAHIVKLAESFATERELHPPKGDDVLNDASASPYFNLSLYSIHLIIFYPSVMLT